MMTIMRFRCEGAGLNMEPEAKMKSVPQKTVEQLKADYASGFPAKRKSVKKMICNCIIHRFCGKCLETNTDTVSSSSPTASSPSMTVSLCSCSPPTAYIYGAGNYGNEARGTICKWQMK